MFLPHAWGAIACHSHAPPTRPTRPLFVRPAAAHPRPKRRRRGEASGGSGSGGSYPPALGRAYSNNSGGSLPSAAAMPTPFDQHTAEAAQRMQPANGAGVGGGLYGGGGGGGGEVLVTVGLGPHGGGAPGYHFGTEPLQIVVSKVGFGAWGVGGDGGCWGPAASGRWGGCAVDTWTPPTLGIGQEGDKSVALHACAAPPAWLQNCLNPWEQQLAHEVRRRGPCCR